MRRRSRSLAKGERSPALLVVIVVVIETNHSGEKKGKRR
jgi:hypothetical protein